MISKKKIFVNLFIIFSLVTFFQFSIFDYLSELVHTSYAGLPPLMVNVMLLFIFCLNLLSITISIFISGLITYFFGKIFNANATKKTFIYIICTTNIIVYLVNIPLAIANFINQDSSKIILLNHPILMFLNPLIYIAVYVFYKLLRSYTKLTTKIIIGYCTIFYFLKILGIIVSQLQFAYL